MREICVPFVNLKHHIFMTYDLLVIFEDYNNKTISPILYIFTLSPLHEEISYSRALQQRDLRYFTFILLYSFYWILNDCNKLADNAPRMLHKRSFKLSMITKIYRSLFSLSLHVYNFLRCSYDPSDTSRSYHSYAMMQYCWNYLSFLTWWRDILG